MIKSWKNGSSAGDVKNIIDYNFNVVSKYLSKDIKALSTQEREMLTSDYLSEKSLVFDTDEEQWYKYSGGSWVKVFDDYKNIVPYTKDISIDDWTNNKISILFDQHGVENPVVQLFMAKDGSLIPVIGGVKKIDSKHNVTLSTDLPFDGRVVIK